MQGRRGIVGAVVGGALALGSLSGAGGFAPESLDAPGKAHFVGEKPTAQAQRKGPRRGRGGSSQSGSSRTTRGASANAAPGPVRGRLENGDTTLQSGEFVDRYTVQFPPGQRVRIRLASRDFDPYLIVRNPAGKQEDNDDYEQGSRDAGIDIEEAASGTYTVLVTSYQAGESGAYQLQYLIGDQGSAPVAQPEQPQQPQQQPGQGAQVQGEGELANGDRTLRSGEFYDSFTRTVDAGQALHIRLESTEFDPYLIVRSPSGRQTDNDDTTPQDRNPTVDFPYTEAGTYTVIVTSYRAGERGHYRLAMSGGGPGPTQTPPVNTQPNAPVNIGHTVAAAPNGGRVFGVFAGISDYPGSQNDLDNCAEDATKLAQALRRSNLMTENQQIVLTDAQVTTGAIRNAMRQMSVDVGPNDIFVFFYSGHGSQRPNSRDPREIDGIDESIFLYDDALLDDEMGQLFDGIQGRLAVLSLDSCFSGGFSKDVITRPGRVGFFSSEEDVESAVASQFQAGGYLSYFLRQGTAGEADNSPHDNVLTVGELEHYLFGQFGRYATDVAMEGAFQHLVVDRGAVRSDQVMWVFR